MSALRQVLRGTSLTIVAMVAVWAASAGGLAGADDGAAPGADLESASAAIPALPGTAAQDDSTQYRHAAAGSVRAEAVATASVTCNGCAAQAVTLQVVYAHNPRTLSAENVATAWSTCTGCHAVVLSLQIIITRTAGTVTAANRALALNVACMGCSTRAAAVQIIVVSPTGRELSFAGRAGSEALRDRLLAQLRTQPTAPLGAAAGRTASSAARVVPAGIAATTQQLEGTVAADVGATSARHDIALRVQ